MSSTREGAQLFALIIGINEYVDPETPSLKGAVADADSVQQYLRDELGVSPSHIKNLRNSEATRAVILQELNNLASNLAIKQDDPILIYFAGHGTQTAAPAQWHWDSPQIQMLLPHDFRQPDLLNKQRRVEGIPDRTLGFLLTNIANRKGNNITVILDCCNSGSGTRGESDSFRVRGVVHDGVVSSDLDDDIVTSTRGSRILPRFRYHGLDSHVLLAACTPEELAHENGGRGAFTRALLRTLSGLTISRTTYGDLIQQLDALPKQHPQCEGDAHRILFKNKIRNEKNLYSAERKDHTLTIHAGAVHGIVPGTVFSIWKKGDSFQDPPVANVTGTQVLAFETHAAVGGELLATSFLAEVKDGIKPNLFLHIPATLMENVQSIFNPDEESGEQLGLVASDKEKADIGLTFSDGNIGFELLDPQELHYGHRSLPHIVHASDIKVLRETLRTIAHYYHQLRRVNDKAPRFGSSKKSLSSMFEVDVYLLDDSLMPVGPTLNVADVGVEIAISTETIDNKYGFKITNHSQFDVYPHLFYFNSFDFSIAALYKPVANAKTDPYPPLKGHEYLVIGYGSDGAQPQSFELSPNTKIEIGFLKLYITTDYVDLSFIPQHGINVGTRGLATQKRKVAHFWDTRTIPFVLKQGDNERPSDLVGILGSQRNGKASFLGDLFRSTLNSPTPKPAFETFFIKEFDVVLPGDRRVSIVDLQAFENEDIMQNMAILKELVRYLGIQYQLGRQFCGFLFTYNISKPRIQPIDWRNLNLVQHLCGENMLQNLVVLTTYWNRPNKAKAFEDRERALIERHFKPCVDHGASFRRYGRFADGTQPAGSSFQSPISVLTLLSGRKSLPLTVQIEASATQTLSGTTAGAAFCSRIEKELQAKVAELKKLNDELNLGGEIVDEEAKQDIEEEIERWRKTLLDCGKDPSV